MLGSVVNVKATSLHLCISNGFNLKIKQKSGLVCSTAVEVGHRPRPLITDPSVEAPIL